MSLRFPDAMSTLAILTVAALTFGTAQPVAAAQDTTLTAASAASQEPEDDDGAFIPAEPDYRVINLPTTLRLPLFKSNFDLTHRFAGNFRRGSFADQAGHLFGIDEGAVVGLEYRFAVARHVQAAVNRTGFARTIQIYGKYDAIHQHAGMPLSASALVSIEGVDNLQEQFAPAIGATVSHIIKDVVAAYAVPMWVHNSAAAFGADRDTFFLGIGGRLRIRPTVYVAAEVSPRLSGYAPGDALYVFAIEKRAGGHMFQLNFTNGSGTTFGQMARGGAPGTLSLGFNLSRKFF